MYEYVLSRVNFRSFVNVEFRNGLEALSGSKPHDYVVELEHLFTFTGHEMGQDTSVRN